MTYLFGDCLFTVGLPSHQSERSSRPRATFVLFSVVTSRPIQELVHNKILVNILVKISAHGRVVFFNSFFKIPSSLEESGILLILEKL